MEYAVQFSFGLFANFIFSIIFQCNKLNTFVSLLGKELLQ